MIFFEVIKKDLLFHQNKFYDDRADISYKFMTLALFDPCFKIVFRYRLYSALYRHGGFFKLIGLFLYLRTRKKYNSDIHPGSDIGVPFKLGHGFNVVIGGSVKVGSGCYIFNGVTLGNKNVGLENAMPVLLNDIIVGTGAKILGLVNVGSRAVIGANSVVTKNIGSQEVWAGNPARLIKKI
jgi:serine O-acetyltransferase